MEHFPHKHSLPANRCSLVLSVALLLSLALIAHQQHRIWTWTQSCPPIPKQVAAPLNNCPQSGQYRVKRETAGDGLSWPPIEYAVEGPPKLETAGVAVKGNRLGEHATADVPLFLPLYTQLSQNALRKMCQEQSAVLQPRSSIELLNRHTLEGDENRTARQKGTRKAHREKVCAPIHSFGSSKLMANRLHRSGSVMRKGDQWFLTEYQTGYTLFQFDLSANRNGTPQSEEGTKKYRRQLESAEEANSTDDVNQLLDFPSRIHTLSEPFRGTDHTIGGARGEETFFYEIAAAGGRIQALHLRTGRRLTKLVYAAKFPLYRHQTEEISTEGEPPFASTVDLEVDQSALWVLFRRPNLSDSTFSPMAQLSVLKLAPGSLKELHQWELDKVDMRKVVNAFVACGQLYAVEVAEGSVDGRRPSDSTGNLDENMLHLRVRPLFDLRTGHYLPSSVRIPLTLPSWGTTGSLSSVQYDAETDSLSVFANGAAYSLQIQRRKRR